MNPLQEAPSSMHLIGFASAAMALFRILLWIFWIYIGWRALMAVERIAKQHGELSASLRTIAQDEE